LRRRSGRLLLPLLAIALTNAIPEPAFSQSANWFMGSPVSGEFSEAPFQMLGSAPSPTPEDLCAAGSTAPHCYTDASKTERKKFVPDFSRANPGHYREYRPGDEKLIEDYIRARKQVAREHFRLGGSH
jgi:hypothetical protein